MEITIRFCVTKCGRHVPVAARHSGLSLAEKAIARPTCALFGTLFDSAVSGETVQLLGLGIMRRFRYLGHKISRPAKMRGAVFADHVLSRRGQFAWLQDRR